MGAAADPWLHPPMPWPRRSLPKTFMCPPELVAFLFVDDCGHDHLPGRERCRHSQSLYLRRTYKSLRSRLMAQPLPRALRRQRQAADEAKVARILREVGDEEPASVAGAAAPGDRLRGIPAIGRGCSGAIRGSRTGESVFRQ